MLVLAIDTSSAAVSAALVEVAAEQVRLISSRAPIDGKKHGELLAPGIEECLAEAFVRPAQLDAVVVGLGPGPFTGLRVGLVTAETMAELLGIPVYGVCSLDGIGAAHPDLERLLVAADARRREVYWAAYERGVRTAGPFVESAAVAREKFGAEGPAAGRAAGAGARLYAEVLGLPLIEQDHPDLLALVRVATDRLLRAAPTEVLTPLYLRRPDAVEPGQSKAVTP